MAKTKFGVSIDDEIVHEIDELVDECTDLGASRSEIVEAVLTAYLRSDVDHKSRIRELIIRRRKDTL
jgi:metal-responsive CopG/Arc/MetJ family transcriptional regulator